jgi:Xaa-Pro aminopeptidase
MTISREEYAGRLSRIRQSMADQGLDALLVYSWNRGQVRYVSGYTPNYIANAAMVVITHHQAPTLFIRFPFDLERARAMCWFKDVRASGDIAVLGRDAVGRLHELSLDQGHIGLVSGDGTMDELPYTLYRQLVDDLPQATFIDARSLAMDLRLSKSPAEFELLRQSARVADAAVEAAGEAVAPGVSEYRLVSIVEAAARSAGADGYLVAIASQGSQELIGPPEHKSIGRGAMVILEAAVQVNGYWTQVARAFTAGAPTDDQQAIYTATSRAYSAAVEAIRPGIPLSTLESAVHAVLEGAGYADSIEHDVGHGIGLDLPEPPSVDANAELPIQEGLVLVIHPAVRVSGVGGAFVGGTVLVTERGPRAIHKIPERLT